MPTPGENQYIYVEPDDPNRCQANHKNGQCRYRAVENTTKCPMHGANNQLIANAKVELRQYQFAKWQSSVDVFADADEVKSLRGEIGIVRLLLQETVARCKDAVDLQLNTPKMIELVKQIGVLVISAHKLETSMGFLLDKTKVLAIAVEIIAVISSYVDPDTATEIGDKIIEIIKRSQGKVDEKQFPG